MLCICGVSSGSSPPRSPRWPMPRASAPASRARSTSPRIPMRAAVSSTNGRLRGSGSRSPIVSVSGRPCWAGILAREERRPARCAHAGVAERVREAEAGSRELSVVGHQLAHPSRLVRPMLRVALLVGDQQQEVRPVHAGAILCAPRHADFRYRAVSHRWDAPDRPTRSRHRRHCRACRGAQRARLPLRRTGAPTSDFGADPHVHGELRAVRLPDRRRPGVPARHRHAPRAQRRRPAGAVPASATGSPSRSAPRTGERRLRALNLRTG